MTAGRQAELIRLLSEQGVPCVVIGGHALGFHGVLRATEDVDVVWVRTAESETKLCSLLIAINASWISDEIDPATRLERLIPVSLGYIQATHLMMLVTDYGFLDLFDYVPGVPDADVPALYDAGVMSDGIRYCSLDWLKKMKKSANRLKDQEDLDRLG